MNYLKIENEDVCNGDGLRVVLWLAGCSHHCHNCQNPQTWDPDSGIKFDEAAEKELFEQLSQDYISGITLSGGDPLDSAPDAEHLLKKIRQNFPDKSIWMYTGYIWEDIYNLEIGYIDFSKPCIDYLDKFSKTSVPGEAFSNAYKQLAISYCDVLIDGPYIDSQRDVTLKWRGSKNQRVIDVQRSLKEQKVVLWCD